MIAFVHVGIDVSKHHLDVFDPEAGFDRIPNREEAVLALAAALARRGRAAVFEATGIVPVRRLELPSNEALLEATKKGYGLAAMSRAVVGPGLRGGELALVVVRGWDVRNTVHVLRIRDAALTPSAELFETFVRARRR